MFTSGVITASTIPRAPMTSWIMLIIGRRASARLLSNEDTMSTIPCSTGVTDSRMVSRTPMIVSNRPLIMSIKPPKNSVFWSNATMAPRIAPHGPAVSKPALAPSMTSPSVPEPATTASAMLCPALLNACLIFFTSRSSVASSSFLATSSLMFEKSNSSSSNPSENASSNSCPHPSPKSSITAPPLLPLPFPPLKSPPSALFASLVALLIRSAALSFASPKLRRSPATSLAIRPRTPKPTLRLAVAIPVRLVSASMPPSFVFLIAPDANSRCPASNFSVTVPVFRTSMSRMIRIMPPIPTATEMRSAATAISAPFRLSTRATNVPTTVTIDPNPEITDGKTAAVPANAATMPANPVPSMRTVAASFLVSGLRLLNHPSRSLIPCAKAVTIGSMAAPISPAMSVIRPSMPFMTFANPAAVFAASPCCSVVCAMIAA